MECPYNEFELKMALISLTDEQIDQVNKLKTEDIQIDNKRIAEFHDISVLDLINSPNYALLCEKYKELELMKVKAQLESIGLSNKQAWALLVGVIKPEVYQ